ncbi:class I SAM-dependent methyltransferase [Dactylosporangium sp. McL0621]|uniref:class I SAM-dependent methyltransferase n=1 Tax=Dactylosporangium sp. McL0621 TaxID=3415678 RepID=UPI003CECB7A1
MRRAKEEVQAGRTAAGGNAAAAIVPHCSDARELPFDDGVFDAVYLVTALGEIPEPARVLSAAARVLKPGGRLVVGDISGMTEHASNLRIADMTVVDSSEFALAVSAPTTRWGAGTLHEGMTPVIRVGRAAA